MADEQVLQKDPLAAEFGRRGGKARVRNQTPEQRRESARRAARARWHKKRGGGDGGNGGGGGGLHATLGGAVEYLPGGGVVDDSRYSVKSAPTRKSARSTSKSRNSEAAGGKRAA